MQAKDIMTCSVATVSPQTPIEEVVQRLIEHGVSALPVVDGSGVILGMVSEGDLIRRPEIGTEGQPSWARYLLDTPEEREASYQRTHGSEARDVMTTPVFTVVETTTLIEIAEILNTRRIKRVPVVRDGRLVGIVSRANLLLGFRGWRSE